MAVGKDATLYASNGTFKLKSSDFPLMANPVSKEDRLVASDWLEERGHDAVADDLRHLTCNATKEQLIAVIELEEFKTWPARQCVVLRLCTIKIAETKEHAQLAVEGLSVAFDQAGEAVSAAAVDGFSALGEAVGQCSGAAAGALQDFAAAVGDPGSTDFSDKVSFGARAGWLTAGWESASSGSGLRPPSPTNGSEFQRSRQPEQ